MKSPASANPQRHEVDQWLPGAGEEEKYKVMGRKNRVSFRGDENFLEVVRMVVKLYECTGWHHQLDGHGFGWTPGVDDGQGGLACCNSWGCKKSDATERLN